jgi:hypothetical protein
VRAWAGQACAKGSRRSRRPRGWRVVEQLLAGLVQGLQLEDFAAQVAELGEPVAGVERQQGVDLLAQALGERGAAPAVEMAICRSPRRTTEGK